MLLAQTGEKFIHHYEVMARRREDKDLLQPALDAHKALFNAYPEVLAADKGFYENMQQIQTLETDIATSPLPKRAAGLRTNRPVKVLRRSVPANVFAPVRKGASRS